MDRIKRFWIIAGFIFLIFIVIFSNSSTTTFRHGDTVPIHYITVDTLSGKPTAPDSIQLVVYHSYTATIIRDTVAMTQWNSEVGQYYYNFEIPDTDGVYTAMIMYWDYGNSTPWRIKRLFYVQDSLFIDVSSLLSTVISSYTTANTLGNAIRIAGDTSLWMDSSSISLIVGASPIKNLLDSLSYMAGWKGSAKSIVSYGSDIDTLIFCIVNDTILKQIFYHTGGVPGGNPDSTKTIAY